MAENQKWVWHLNLFSMTRVKTLHSKEQQGLFKFWGNYGKKVRCPDIKVKYSFLSCKIFETHKIFKVNTEGDSSLIGVWSMLLGTVIMACLYF